MVFYGFFNGFLYVFFISFMVFYGFLPLPWFQSFGSLGGTGGKRRLHRSELASSDARVGVDLEWCFTKTSNGTQPLHPKAKENMRMLYAQRKKYFESSCVIYAVYEHTTRNMSQNLAILARTQEALKIDSNRAAVSSAKIGPKDLFDM